MSTITEIKKELVFEIEVPYTVKEEPKQRKAGVLLKVYIDERRFEIKTLYYSKNRKAKYKAAKKGL